MKKIASAAEVAALVKDNDTVAFSGHGAMGTPEDIFLALSDHFEKTNHPQNITIFKGVSLGNRYDRKGSGLCYLTRHDGLVGTMMGAHNAMEPTTLDAISKNKMMSYNLPLGTVQQILRSMVGKKPGFLTNVGLKTFADPRLGGGKGNKLTIENGKDIVKLITIDDHEMLYYPYFPIDICFVRASLSDTEGNISLEDEAIITANYEMVAATRNSGGIVVVIVNQIVEKGCIHPKNVAMHGSMVDYVVQASPKYCSQSIEFECLRPELAGHYKIPINNDEAPQPFNIRKIIGRRAAMQLKKGDMANFGIGIPEYVTAVAREEGFLNKFENSIETGTFGGIPMIGISFGATLNPSVLMRADDILQWYDGGGLDIAFLGGAEFDQKGNVNVTRFNGKSIGPGGFVDISQNTHRVCFLGTFTAEGLDVKASDGKLEIIQEGKFKKLLKNVEEVSFSGDYAIETSQEVLYITERAVFTLSPEGLMLIEIAPGIDLQRDVLDQMEFTPIISKDLKFMDERIFSDSLMGLKINE